MLKNSMFLETIFHRNFSILASENGPQIEDFAYHYRKRRFCKNHCFSYAKLLFFRFGGSKKHTKIDAKTHCKITSKKRTQKSNFGIHFGLPKPPKSLLKATQNQACFATLCKTPATRRKATGAIAFGLLKWLGI